MGIHVAPAAECLEHGGGRGWAEGGGSGEP